MRRMEATTKQHSNAVWVLATYTKKVGPVNQMKEDHGHESQVGSSNHSRRKNFLQFPAIRQRRRFDPVF